MSTNVKCWALSRLILFRSGRSYSQQNLGCHGGSQANDSGGNVERVELSRDGRKRTRITLRRTKLLSLYTQYATGPERVPTGITHRILHGGVGETPVMAKPRVPRRPISCRSIFGAKFLVSALSNRAVVELLKRDAGHVDHWRSYPTGEFPSPPWAV